MFIRSLFSQQISQSPLSCIRVSLESLYDSLASQMDSFCGSSYLVMCAKNVMC